MRNRTPISWISRLIALAFVSVALFGIFTYRNTAAVRRGEALIAQSYAVREATQALLSSVKDMETGERGFLITGVAAYLEPYYLAVRDLDGKFSRLRKLTDDNPAQWIRLDRLQQLVEERRTELAETIKIRSEEPELSGFDKTREIIMAGHGRKLMDDMRAVVRDMLDDEQTLLVEREAAANWRAMTSQGYIIAGNLMALALLVLSGVVSHFDRKKRDEAEASLRLSQAELSAIFDSAGDGIVTFDEDLRIRLLNPTAAEWYQCNARSALGRSLLDFVPPRLHDVVAHDIRTFLHSDLGTRPLTTGTALRSDGSEFPCAGTLAIAAPPGEKRFITSIFRDLSESQARDAKIREHVEILNQIRDAIVVCDMHDHIIFWNHGAQSLFGYSEQQAMGRNVVDLLFDVHREQWETGRATMLDTGSFSTEFSHRDAHGREITFEHRRSLIQDEAGRPAAQLILQFDITTRKTEEALRRRSQRLESIGTLAGGISHDLNNVLTPILMSAKLLKRGGDHQERLLDAIVISAERGSQMIKKLLAFAGGELGSHDRIDVRENLLEAEEILRHTLPKSICLHVECDEHVYPIRGDATELSQVLMNLAINARDAMPDGGRLELRAENVCGEPPRSDRLQTGPYVLIRASDTGHGIPPENIERIFDPFFTTKEQGKGTGLGLATSVGIVRSHGGDITVSSRPGEGTVFSIYMPAANIDEARAGETNIGEALSGKGELIMLVDDEPLVVSTAHAALEAAGYRVMTASGGAEAAALFRRQADAVDVILLDMMMPGMDGFATKDALRAIQPRVPIVASSGLRRPGAEGGQWADIDGFLPKPYSDEQLLRIVRKVLDSRAAKQRKGD